MALTEIQSRYAEARAAGRTPLQAARLAGCSPNGVRHSAQRLESLEHIQVRIEELRPGAARDQAVTIDWVVAELRDVALAAKGDGDRAGQLRALDMLAKHVGAYERNARAGAPVIHIGGLDVASLERMARPALEAQALEAERLLEADAR